MGWYVVCVQSGLDLERGRAISDYVKVVGLAACSIAISILMWRLRPGSPPEFHLLGHNHQQPRKPGIVFPLYQYYHQWGNRSHRERSGRGLRAENPLFDLRWVQRSLDDLNRHFLTSKFLCFSLQCPLYALDSTIKPKMWNRRYLYVLNLDVAGDHTFEVVMLTKAVSGFVSK